jgi:hypothetical protein
MTIETEIARRDGFVLTQYDRSGSWRYLKLTHPVGFRGAGRRFKRNWSLAWNGERISSNADSIKLKTHQPAAYAWVVETLSKGQEMVTTQATQAVDDQPTFWRVRVCMPGSILHFTSSTEPVVQMRDGRVGDVTMELLTTTQHRGDTVGFIDWPVVTGLTWRSFKPETAE